MPQLDLQQLQNDIDSLKKELQYEKDERAKFRSIFDAHQHQGQDKSSLTQGKPNVLAGSISLSGGDYDSTPNQSTYLLPFIVTDNNSSMSGLRNFAEFGVVNTKKDTSTEQVSAVIGAGKFVKDSVVKTDKKNALTYIRAGYIPGAAAGTPTGYFTGASSPLIVSPSATGAITHGAATLTDTTLNLTVNSLTNTILCLLTATGTLLEAYVVVSNTATVLTLADVNGAAAAFWSGTGSYYYVVYNPISLGGTTAVWRTIAAGAGIQFGIGPSPVGSNLSGTQTFLLSNVSNSLLALGASFRITGKWGSAYDDHVALTNNFTLTPATSYVFVSTNSGIAKCATMSLGSFSGQTLIVQGRYNSGGTIEFNINTANLQLSIKGATSTCRIGLFDTISMVYDDLSSQWVETSRTVA